MKVPAALFVALASILVSGLRSEYVHPPIPPPPPPPSHFKYSSPPIPKGGGQRWTSNSLGPPRFHHHHHRHHQLYPPSATAVHHHIPHRPTITVHHHVNPLPSLTKSQLHVHHLSSLHHSHSPTKGLAHHHHHHHLLPGGVHRPSPPAFNGPWKGPVGGGFGGSSSLKDNFHPSPPDSQKPPVVATHQAVDDNKGPIHTIPAPNLGPSGKHHHQHLSSGAHGFSGQDSGFQTGHGIGQGVGEDASGGPYPNPVYGKPATADLTYHEPKVPANVEAEVALDPHIPTITIQSSHAYQVHDQSFNQHATAAPLQIGFHGVGGAYFAPDPDPSIPAPKVPFTTDPYSHPTNGQSPPDLDYQIPQHLLAIYGIRQQDQQLQLPQQHEVPLQPQAELQFQPQAELQFQPQVELQLQPHSASGGSVDGGYGDLGGRLLLAQALAQYEAQTHPDALREPYAHQPVQAPIAPLAPVQSSSGVSIQEAPLVASVHETIYPVSVGGSVSDGHGGQLSVYDLFANSPVRSPVLEAIQEDFRQTYPSSMVAPATASAAGDHFRYADQFRSTTPAPQQFHSTTLSPISLLSGANNYLGYQQQVFSSTAAPPLAHSAADNNFGYQQQFHSTTPAPALAHSTSDGNFGNQQQQYHSTTPAPTISHSALGNNFGYQPKQPYQSTTTAPLTALSTVDNNFAYHQQQFPLTTAAPPVSPSDDLFAFHQQGNAYDRGAPLNQGLVTELYHDLGAAFLSNHRAQGVSVSNPGQAGYIAASYHHQSSNAAPLVAQVTTGGFQASHDTSASESRDDQSRSVATAGVAEKGTEATSGGYSGNLLDVGPKKETVRPSSSSSFYGASEGEGGASQSSAVGKGAQEEEYYDDAVSQQVDVPRKPASPPSLPSAYGMYESYAAGAAGSRSPPAEEQERQEEEYDSEEYDEYPEGGNEAPSTTTRHGGEAYDHGVEFGTRLKPKKNQ